ncbi:MAG: chemotaxis protein CheV [Proteobacteria bacterium]|nr:MAG: chemotaxis protein CheV [Pseudomonadota bacterium]
MSKLLEGVDQRTQIAGHNRLELLLFRLAGKQIYGINVFKVQEVIHCPALTKLPGSDPKVRGIANMRGKTLPVIDLSLSIGGPSLGGEGGFVIIAEYNRTLQGFLVGSVDKIANKRWEEVLPPPKGTGKGSYMTAVTEVEGQMVAIIDVEKVLSEINKRGDELPEEFAFSAPVETALPKHILAVDDSMVARRQIMNSLKKIGVDCTIARNGREALDTLRKWADEGPIQERIAMVISDVEMPEMDGYTLTTEIRKDPRLAGLFVILHTSLSGVFNQALVEKVGANRFLAKFDAEEFANVVLGTIRELGGGEPVGG